MKRSGVFAAVSLAVAVSVTAGEPPAEAPADAPPSTASQAAAKASMPAADAVATDADAAADLAAARAASSVSTVARPAAAAAAPTEVTLDKRNAFAAGVRFGGPLGGSLRLSLLHGLGAKVREKDQRVDAVCAVPIPHCAGGFLLDAEAGSGGGKLSLGVGANARVQDEDFRGTVGAGLKLSVARTWGNPVGTDPGLTYLGPELDLFVLRVGVSVGVLFRVAGDGGGTTLFTWGLGLRL